MRLLERLHNPESRYTVMELTRWLWRRLHGNRLQTVLNAIIGLLSVVVSLLMVWAMQRAIDIASGFREGSIYWAVAVMGGLILCEFALSISRVWIKNILGVKAQNVMQQQMLDRLLRSEWRGRETRHSGDVMNRLEQDVRTVVTFITETLPSTVSTMVMFIGAFVYLWQMDRWLATITVAILPVFLAVSRIYVSQMRKFSRRVRNSDSEIQSLMTEAVQHRMLLKTLEAGSRVVERLVDQQSELRRHVRRRTQFSIASNLFVNGGFSLGYLIAFLWGAVRMSAKTITFGQMTAFLQLVNRIQGPARDLTRLAPAFVHVFTAAERLMELEEVPEEQQGEGIRMGEPCGVRLEGVSFTYDDGTEPVLNRLTFDFRPGTCTAILGETGAGKTTLVRLVLALMQPTEGRVVIYRGKRREERGERIDERGEWREERGERIDERGERREERGEISPLHRCNFVYVPQGNTLLSGSVRDNLLLAQPDATDDDLWRVLRMACADFVETLPQGLDTMLTEVGGGLSEGQAQRIAIARALLRDRPVMIFDEATSALDGDTERRLLANILADHRKTVLFITHRPAVVDYCDQSLTVG